MKAISLLPVAVVLLLLLGTFGSTIHSGDSVEIETQRGREVDSVKDLTPAQQSALENIRTTSRVDGRATDAQPVWEWANSAGGSYAAHASDIVVDLYGNTYIIGFFGNGASSAGSSAEFGEFITLNSSSNLDVFVAKLDPDGNWLWAKQAGGSGYDYGWGIAVDQSGSYIYITGYFGFSSNSSADFGSTTLNSSGDGDVFIAKLDSDGNWLWAKQAGGSGSDQGYGITVHPSGNYIYVTGEFQSSSADFGSITLNSSGGSDVFVAKLNSNGDWLWTTSAGGTNSDSGNDIAVDRTGRYIYVTGIFYESYPDFGSTTLNWSGAVDVFVAKLDSDGNWLWAEQAGGSGHDFVGGIAVDSYGNAYISGSGASMAFGSVTTNSGAETSAFVAKLDPNGNWLWAERGGSISAGFAIAISSSSVFVTGIFEELALFGSTTLNSSDGDDVFVAELDLDGNWLWAKQAGGGSGSDHGKSIAVDQSGTYIYITGYFGYSSNSSADFGSTTLFSRGGQSDVFVYGFAKDSDSDNMIDSEDACAYGVTGWMSSPSTDYDSDGCRDSDEDMDDDNDGVYDAEDDCPTGDLEWVSTSSTDYDSDGCQDSSSEDIDIDNDLVVDASDDCPRGNLEWISNPSTDLDDDGCEDGTAEDIEPLVVNIGSIELSAWDLLGIIVGLFTSSFVGFAFVTRGGRFERLSAAIAKSTAETFPSLEKRLEFASFVKLISPRQSIKLEALLDERKESLGKQESAETEDENLREQLANKSTSDGQVEEMEIELDRLQESMADAENTKIQMKGEMDEIRKSGDDSSLKMQDSVIGGDSIVGSTNIETQIINEPEAIARAAIEAYRIAKNEDID